MNCITTNCGTSVFDELDRGVNELMRGYAGPEIVSSEDPRLSLYEFENRYVIECDLPGVAIDDITLSLENRVLTISGQRKESPADGSTRVLFNERTASEFHRSLYLAHHIDRNAVDAEMSAGVLRITVEKPAEVLPRKIEIRRSSPAA